MTYEIDISCSDPNCRVDLKKLQAAIAHGLKVEGVAEAVLSVTIVDNSTIHQLNLTHLQHDFPTDVISFQLDWTCDDGTLEHRSQQSEGRSRDAMVEGEIIASAEYATEMANRCGWSAEDELTLYVIHGMLHICGYDDLTDAEKRYMRLRERAVLEGLGLRPEYPDDAPHDDEPPGPAQGNPNQRSSSPGESLEDLR